ncbi:MAG TPA: flippase [Bacteroidota bacterium]|nr:flippase [Bacteroidota bacterium]
MISSVRRNTVYSFLSSSIRLVSNLLMFVGIARFYDVKTFGQFTTAHTFLMVFFLFADFGFDMLVTTGIARERDRSAVYIRRYLPMKIIFSLSSFLCMALIALVSDFSRETKLFMIILSSGIVANAVSSFCYAVFKGYEDLSQEFRVSLVQNSVLLCCLVLLGFLGVPAMYVALAFVGSRVIGALMIAPKLFSIQKLRSVDFRSSGWLSIIRDGIPFGVHLIFGTLFFQMDTILLSYFRGDESVGIYQAAMRLVYGIFIIPDVLSNAFIPMLSRLHSENHSEWTRVGKVLQKTLMFSSLPLGIIFYLYADQLIPLIYGSRAFTEAIPLMRIFAFIIVLRFSVETYAMILTVSRVQEWRMRIVIFLTVFNLTLNIFAIPRYGVTGAAFVSLATNFVAGILYVAAAHIRAFRFSYAIEARPILAIATVILSAGFLGALGVHSMFIGIPAILLVSLIVYYLVGYSREERKLIFSMPSGVSISGSR